MRHDICMPRPLQGSVAASAPKFEGLRRCQLWHSLVPPHDKINVKWPTAKGNDICWLRFLVPAQSQDCKLCIGPQKPWTSTCQPARKHLPCKPRSSNRGDAKARGQNRSCHGRSPSLQRCETWSEPYEAGHSEVAAGSLQFTSGYLSRRNGPKPEF